GLCALHDLLPALYLPDIRHRLIEHLERLDGVAGFRTGPLREHAIRETNLADELDALIARHLFPRRDDRVCGVTHSRIVTPFAIMAGQIIRRQQLANSGAVPAQSL